LCISDWQPVHSERHLVKVVGGAAGHSDSEHHLPHDIDSHAFTKFTNIYFKVSLFALIIEEYQNLRVFNKIFWHIIYHV
jgi:hypothetical protein